MSLRDSLLSLQHRTRRLRAFTRRRLRRRGMSLKQHLFPPGVLPDFLIIGSMKCGTTTLFHMLSTHPGVEPPATKEIQFFNQPWNHARGEGWYRAHFPGEQRMQRLAGQLGYRPLTGEATPAMSVPLYAENAAALVPGARLVVTLRNPVERAYSHFQHMRHHPRPERRGFAEALEAEQRLLEEGIRLNADNFRQYGGALVKFGYLNRGRYALELEHWLRFFPREQMLILNFDAWKREPEQAAARVTEFLGLPPHPYQARRSNRGVYPEPMPADCREFLTEFYRPWNRQLFDLLGEDWGWPT